MLDALHKEVKKLANPEKAKLLARFFKTGKGEYGEGDIFLGITVPQSRKIAIKYRDLPFDEISKLLRSKIHEERLIALIILIQNFEKKSKRVISSEIEKSQQRKRIFNLYLSHTKHINNWDLVDLSAHKIVGAYLYDKPKDMIYELANSENLWERRIAVISTFYFIARNEFDESLCVAEILLQDRHDLIHKAVGWMLREVGKRDQNVEELFLIKYYKTMPRTMLRYAIEKFSPQKRAYYLNSSLAISNKHTGQQ